MKHGTCEVTLTSEALHKTLGRLEVSRRTAAGLGLGELKRKDRLEVLNMEAGAVCVCKDPRAPACVRCS